MVEGRAAHRSDGRPADRPRAGAGDGGGRLPRGPPVRPRPGKPTGTRARHRPARRLLDRVEVDPDLCEWDYGDYEGVTTPSIRETIPGWTVWSHPLPGGETAEEVGNRADRVIARIRGAGGDVAIFAHGHVLRVLAARWIDLPPTEGRHFALHTATISILGWERENPVIDRWNAPCGAD